MKTLHSWNVIVPFCLYYALALLVVPLFYLVVVVLWTGEPPQQVIVDSLENGWMEIASVVVSGMGLILYLLWLPIKERQSIWGQRKRSFFVGVGTWVIAFPCVFVVGQGAAMLTKLLFGTQETDQIAVKHLKAAVTEPLLLVMTVICLVVIVPIVEELLFRGFLQCWLRERLGPKFTIVITALIFALCHYAPSQELRNLELVSALFVLALFLSFLTEKKYSLWAPIALHMTFNAVNTCMILVSVKF